MKGMQSLLGMLFAFGLLGCTPDVSEQIREAKLLLDREEYTQAISLLEPLAEQGGQADAWNMLGVAYLYGKKEAEKSVQFFNKAIKADNQNYKYYYNRANAYREQKMLLEALDDYEEAIQKAEGKSEVGKASQADIYFNKAAILLVLNRPKEAIPTLESCLGLSPDFAKAHYGLGTALLATGQPSEQACQHLSKAVALGYAEAQAVQAQYCGGLVQ